MNPMKKLTLTIVEDMPQPDYIYEARKIVERAKVDPEFATKMSYFGNTFEEAEAIIKANRSKMLKQGE